MCSIKLVEIYNFVDIEAIQDIVHIIPALIQTMNILLINLYFK